MPDPDRWRHEQERDRYRSRDDRYGREEGRYEDWGGRPDQGRFTGEGGWRGGMEGRHAAHGRDGRSAAAGDYGYGVAGRDVRHEPPGAEGRGGYAAGDDRGKSGGDLYGGFYGADQNYGLGRREDGRYGSRASNQPGDDRRGYLDRPHADAWRRLAESGHGPERGFWDRATDELAAWFRGGERPRGSPARGEHRGRGPKGYSRSDERIIEDVNDRLTDDPYLDATEIEVGVANREVTLSGTVDSREAKRRAEDLADGVAGVVHVQNNLRVAARAGSAPAGSASPAAPAATAPVTTPPLGKSITAMNSRDANRIARETVDPAPPTPPRRS